MLTKSLYLNRKPLQQLIISSFFNYMIKTYQIAPLSYGPNLYLLYTKIAIKYSFLKKAFILFHHDKMLLMMYHTATEINILLFEDIPKL